MVAAVELYFDHVADRRVRRLWDALEDVDVPSLRDHTHRRHRPHLSLVVAPCLDPDAVRAALAGLDVVPRGRVSLDFAGVFVGRVLWLGVAPSSWLLAHQAAVSQRLAAAGIAVDPRYRPGAWVPHVTMSMRVPRPVLAEAVRVCLETLPIEVCFTSAAVADHTRDLLVPL